MPEIARCDNPQPHPAHTWSTVRDVFACTGVRLALVPPATPELMADEPSFEELLADPNLSFDLDSEVLPHLLAFGPPKDCCDCRTPWIYCATHTAQTTAAAPPQSVQP